MQDMVNELQTNYLNQLGLQIRINPDYNFNGGKARWLAVYQKSLGKIKQGIIPIAINYPFFYSKMCKMKTDRDKFNIKAQARITIGHEIGHGLVDYIKGLNIPVLSGFPNLKMIQRCGSQKEERLVEEFGEYQFVEATGTWDSSLVDGLEELVEYNKKSSPEN